MDKKNLDNQINKWIKKLDQGEQKLLLDESLSLKSIYPFNKYEYQLMYLLDKKAIIFPEYKALRDLYINSNPYLYLYKFAPRVFGEIWAQKHLMDSDSRFKKASTTTDAIYSGEYDLNLISAKGRIIKIEVKASRAINTKDRAGLDETALSFNSAEPFWMNFQQIKLKLADVFIFVGVWADKILYWVLTEKEVKNHPTISHQHRGGIEFQIGITDKNIKEFNKYLVPQNKLADIILKKVKK